VFGDQSEGNQYRVVLNGEEIITSTIDGAVVHPRYYKDLTLVMAPSSKLKIYIKNSTPEDQNFTVAGEYHEIPGELFKLC
jgi:hypothetical protein